MIKMSSFAIHLTYTCPLTCKHCCFQCSPKVKDRLSEADVHNIIDSLHGKGLRLLAFTGGEPFLFGKSLPEFVSHGKSSAETVRIVTSAYWATSEANALRRLEPLRAAGLDELSISWDDYHEEFVSFDNVKHAFWQAKKLGIAPAICIVQSPKSRWTAELVRERLDGVVGEGDIVVESPLNYTGRAEEELVGSGVKESHFLGPCPYVMTGPTVSAKGKVLACCGVIPETDDLVIGSSLEPNDLMEAIETGAQSALMSWLHIRGPYSVMRYISAKHEVPIPSPDEVGGNCEACKLLFATPDIRKHLRSAVEEMRGNVASEMAVLEAAGLMNSAGLVGLWQGGMA
jgi:hypothetical protein